jgi:hypothetical protein
MPFSSISSGTRAMSSPAVRIAEHVWDEHSIPFRRRRRLCQRLRRKLDHPGLESAAFGPARRRLSTRVPRKTT